MGGDVPGLMGVLPALVASILLSLVLLVKKTVTGTLLATIGAQYVFHQWSGLGAITAHGHVHGEIQPLVATIGADTSMTLAHALAAAVTALFVVGSHQFKQSLATLAELVAHLVLRALPPYPASLSAAPRFAPFSFSPASIMRGELSGAHGLRGPPVFA
jgi:hypothetical protein